MDRYYVGMQGACGRDGKSMLLRLCKTYGWLLTAQLKDARPPFTIVTR